MEKSRSWSSAHDWKSCNRQKRFESSNLSFSANKNRTFVYRQMFCFCLSKPQAWHIIAAQRAVHIIKGGKPPLYLITRQRASTCGLMIYNGKPLMIYRNKLRMICTPSADASWRKHLTSFAQCDIIYAKVYITTNKERQQND